jgi:superfamily II DNA or RNA helicase
MGQYPKKLKKASLNSIPFWHHQSKAINTVRNYIRSYEEDNTIGSSLIHMPTGTGKSGVIAAISHFIRKVECVLLLCPRIALRDQLASEVRGRFFSRFNIDENSLKKKVIIVKENILKLDVDDYNHNIIVMTNQMLYSIYSNNREQYNNLRKHIDIVVVDEGHYEPAVSWSEAIRKLNKPKVIFTATPFRNDIKLFDINYDLSYSYTLKDAFNDNIVRQVEVLHRKHPVTPNKFVKEVVDIYDEKLNDSSLDDKDKPRVIIRCDTKERIRQIGSALKNLGKSHVLIHERFEDNNASFPNERKTVPNPDVEDAIFWVHQYKLLEGIDDPKFQLLALYEELSNARSFIQQVGRVIRNPNKILNSFAYVLDHSSGRQTEYWNEYLEFDEYIKIHGIKVADFGGKYLEEISKILPDVVYYDGRFRSKVNLPSIDPSEDLVLPKTVNVYKKRGKYKLKDISENVIHEYNDYDCIYNAFWHDNHTYLIIYIYFSNSRLLRNKLFIENKLGVSIIREVDDYICYFNSGNIKPNAIYEYTENISDKDFRRLYNNNLSYLTEISSQNSNLGTRAIRSRKITASNMENIVPSFDAHSFVCRTARGYVNINKTNKIRRYVGFQKGKISDSTGNYNNLDEYLQWLDEMTTLISSRQRGLGLFERYAKPTDVPKDATPVNILLDVLDVQESFFTNNANDIKPDKPMIIEDLCSEIKNGAFNVNCNGVDCDVQVSYDGNLHKYILNSAELDSLYYSNDENLKSGVINYLNSSQSFRIIPKSEDSFYTLGEFYSPILRFGPSYSDEQFGLLRIMESSRQLDRIGSEKGKCCLSNGSGWDKNSLFSIIDNLGKNYGMSSLFGKPDIVVCDDMGTEAADFILGYTDKRKVVFIHAKGNNKEDNIKYAASPLMEVCGQATKNLKYFSRYDNIKPPKAPNWHISKWSAPPHVAGQVNNRIRKKLISLNTGMDVWGKIQSIIRDPMADLHVWLFLGRILSKSILETQLKQNNTSTEAKQSAYLLLSTMNDVASSGARLRIICSP